MPPAELPDLPTLLDRYERPLVRYAASLLHDVDAARDIVQETFIRLARLRATSGGPQTGRLEAWLFTVCRNCAIDHQRKHARIIPMPTLETDRADEAPNPAVQLEQSETAALLLRLMDRLSPNQREVIRLKFQNDLSYKEIADVTQLSVTNVGFLLHTALKKLRALMVQTPGEAWTGAATTNEA